MAKQSVAAQMKALGYKTLHLFIYDVPAEHGALVANNPQLARWCANMRITTVWRTCRAVCGPTQKSVWTVPDEILKPTIDQKTGLPLERFGPGLYTFADAVEHWKDAYRQKGLSVLMEIIPIATTPEGYDVFKKQEQNTLFMMLSDIKGWMGDVKQAGKTTTPAYRLRKKNRDTIKYHIERDYGPKSKDWPETEDMYNDLMASWNEVNDELNDLQNQPIRFKEKLKPSGQSVVEEDEEEEEE